jgi:glycosyltransferase involved in cell wall biosynthesis
MPSVDCVIPAFNPSRDYLARAVASALAVPGLRRCIVVDNGSARPVERPEGILDTRLEIIRQENTGPSGARNTGIEAATGDVIILLDHDDELLPKGVVAMIALIEKLDAVACIAARYERGGLGYTKPKDVPPEWANRALPRPGEVFRPVAIFGASGVLITRRLIEAGVRFDPDLRIGEDRDFLRRAADVGPIAVCSSSALMVQLHGGTENLSSMANLDRRIADHVRLVAKHYAPADDAHWREATRWLVNAASKHPVADESWRSLTSLCRSRRWPVPIKCRLRRMFKKPT